MIYIDLILNLSLLVALSMVSGFFENRFSSKTGFGVVLQGFLFGGTALLGMMRPLPLGPGLIFDGRSVMVSLCALFFGPRAAAVSVGMTVAYRLWLGGTGTFTGSMVILSSAGIGLYARFFMKSDENPPSSRHLFLFGLTVHLAMLALMFTLPHGAGPAVVKRIGLPVLTLYPLATILTGKILSDRIEALQRIQTLREREERYSQLFNSSSDAVFVHGLTGGKPSRFIEINDAACSQLGYSREELLKMTPRDIDDPETEISRRHAADAIRKTGGAVFEMIHVAKTGDRIPVEISSRIFRNKGEEFVLSIARNLTERKRAETLLQESENKFRRIAEHSLVGIYLVQDGIITYVNPKFSEIFGYTVKECLNNMPFLHLVHPDDSRRVNEQARKRLNGENQEAHYQFRGVKKTGEMIHIDIFGSLIQYNGKLSLTGTLLDITDRQMAFERQRLNESRLRRIVDILQKPTETIQEFLDYALNQAILLTDSKIGYIYHYHEDRKEFILNTWSKEVMAECAVVNPQTCYELDKTGIWGEAVRQRRPIVVNDFAADNPLIKGYPPGHVHLKKFMTVPIFQEDKIVGVVGLANKTGDYDDTDILQISLMMEVVWKVTERKQIEEDILHLNESLEQRVALEVEKNLKNERLLIQQSRLAAMGEMIGNIAHQWRQPLNALGMLLFNIKDAFQSDGLDSDYLNRAVADGNRLVQKMSATISDFSNFFRPDKGIRAFSALEQIREATALVASSFEGHHIGIRIDAPQDLQLAGFPNEYSQVLLNLLINAKDAILAGYPPIAGRVDIVVSQENGLGSVSVRDNGGGIPQDILDRIFDPYFTTKENGSGIGLYMSKMIIERNMKGRISAKNIAGGAEFRIDAQLAANTP